MQVKQSRYHRIKRILQTQFANIYEKTAEISVGEAFSGFWLQFDFRFIQPAETPEGIRCPASAS
jgi:hypothetical protein